MKYLKYFENNVLYQEIPLGSSLDSSFGNFERVDISSKTIQLLNDHINNRKFKDFEIEECFQEQTHSFLDKDFVEAFAVFFKKSTDLEISIFIYEYTDDWFMISIFPFDRGKDSHLNYCDYKCDTIEGVFQVLDKYIQ